MPLSWNWFKTSFSEIFEVIWRREYFYALFFHSKLSFARSNHNCCRPAKMWSHKSWTIRNGCKDALNCQNINNWTKSCLAFRVCKRALKSACVCVRLPLSLALSLSLSVWCFSCLSLFPTVYCLSYFFLSFFRSFFLSLSLSVRVYEREREKGCTISAIMFVFLIGVINHHL